MMGKYLIPVFSLVLWLGLSVSPAIADSENDLVVDHDEAAALKRRISLLKNSIDFVIDNAYDKKHKTFFSEVDNNGNLMSRKIHLVSLSRMIYALSYSSRYFPDNLQLAKDSAHFLLQNMIAENDSGTYFISELYVDEAGDIKHESAATGVDIWQQAYGLNGLVELYRYWPDSQLLAVIRRMHHAFVNNFYDSVHGGFYGYRSFDTGHDENSKTLQSVVYPVSAYMANLWEVDPKKEAYESLLSEQLQLAYNKLWNEDLGWVNVKFNNKWQPCNKPDKACNRVMPGHNFQLAWLFLRTREWLFIKALDRQAYQDRGRHIVDRTLAKNIWDQDLASGFFREFDRQGDKMLSDKKSWWQHSEAVIALSFMGADYRKPLTSLESFFERYFVDHKSGGEYFFLDENNVPLVEQAKVSKGKSSYHTTEMLRFLIENNQAF